MAILKSILGQISGSIGEMTLHRQKGTRSVVTKKVTVVANPNTVMQRSQRIKMQPAALFYNAYENVLNHSRQGLRIGNAHRQAFMKEVLKGEFTGVPYVVKGTSYWVPGRYPMSKGSIPSVDFVFGSIGGGLTSLGVIIDDEEFTAYNIGTVSKFLLKKYPFLQNGDEICFVWAEIGRGGREFYAHEDYFIIDETSEKSMPEVLIFDSNHPQYLIVDNENCVAGCVIVSRKVNKKFHYSKTDMILRGDFAAEVYSEKRYQAAINSYTAAGANAINSPYILQQSTEQPYRTQIRVFNAMLGAEEITYMASVAIPVGGSAASGTIIGVFTDDGTTTGAIIDWLGNPLIDADTGNVKPSDIGWSGQVLKWEPYYIQQVVR